MGDPPTRGCKEQPKDNDGPEDNCGLAQIVHDRIICLGAVTSDAFLHETLLPTVVVGVPVWMGSDQDQGGFLAGYPAHTRRALSPRDAQEKAR